MSYNTEELEINNHFQRLSIHEPKGLYFVPENLESVDSKEEFIFTETVTELNKYFKLEKVNIDCLGGQPEIYRSRKNADIFLPAIFISYSAFLENSNIVSIAINIISSFIYDNMRGKIGKKTASIEFYIEKKEKGKITKIAYKGDAEGLKDFDKVIKSL